MKVLTLQYNFVSIEYQNHPNTNFGLVPPPPPSQFQFNLNARNEIVKNVFAKTIRAQRP